MLNNQTIIDMVALATNDSTMLNLAEKARKNFEAGYGVDWKTLADLVAQAIDNTYGVGSFDMYKNTGILPSKQH